MKLDWSEIRSQSRKRVKFVIFWPMFFFNCERTFGLIDVPASISDRKTDPRCFDTIDDILRLPGTDGLIVFFYWKTDLKALVARYHWKYSLRRVYLSSLACAICHLGRSFVRSSVLKLHLFGNWIQIKSTTFFKIIKLRKRFWMCRDMSVPLQWD